MTDKKIYMCSQCDTEHDTQDEAVFCCQCESCNELKAQLEAVRDLKPHVVFVNNGHMESFESDSGKWIDYEQHKAAIGESHD